MRILIFLSVVLSLVWGQKPAKALKLPEVFSPNSLAQDSHGNTYIAAMRESSVYKMDTEGKVFLFAGVGQKNFKEGKRLEAAFRNPYSVAVDSKNNIYVADSGNNRIRRIDAKTGLVSTLAGSSTGHADGKASEARFNFPYGLTIDKDDNLYVSDQRNHSIRKISRAGKVTTIAGKYAKKEGKFYYPSAIAFGTDGKLYVLDNASKDLKRLEGGGKIASITDPKDNKSILRIRKENTKLERVAINQ
ncbi:MAG: SMP-30/gluconolactonase/LRE family protein [Candidatus Melainabacteria bacterium]|nr:SMP-30/gluconolactonase/LRE family protein [Candidatus Melainabacteria bacterium]